MINVRSHICQLGVLLIFLGGCSATHSPATTPATQTTEFVFPTVTSTEVVITPTHTSTPLPTLSPEDAYQRLQDLLENNAGCRLPCWWGITPGKTTWSGAEAHLKTFMDLSAIRGTSDLFAVDTHFLLPNEKGTLDHTYYIKTNTVIGIDAYVYDLMPSLYLSNFLTEYGPPDEVFLRTFRRDEDGSQPYQIDLFYGKLGMLLEYSGGDPNTVGEKIQNCFDDMYSPFIYTWSPDTPMTSAEAIEKLLDTENMPYPVPIDKATGMDVITFYETFKNSDNTICLETPSNLWP